MQFGAGALKNVELCALLVACGACACVGCSVVVFLCVCREPSMDVFLKAECIGGVKAGKRKSVGTPVDVVGDVDAPFVFFVESAQEVVMSVLLSKGVGCFASDGSVMQKEVWGSGDVREYRQGAFGDVVGVLCWWVWAVLGQFDVMMGHLWRKALGCMEKVVDDIVVWDQWVGRVLGWAVDDVRDGDGRVSNVYCSNVAEVMVGD